MFENPELNDGIRPLTPNSGVRPPINDD